MLKDLPLFHTGRPFMFGLGLPFFAALILSRVSEDKERPRSFARIFALASAETCGMAIILSRGVETLVA